MKYLLLALATVFCIVCSTPLLSAAEGKLPLPQKSGGKAIFNAIEERASAQQASFPTGIISQEEIATVLWATSGRSRKDTAWTVPTAKGYDPYVTVYLLAKDGAYRYEGKTHSLVKVTGENLIPDVSRQPFATTASNVLLFVSKLGSARDTQFGHVLVGAMTQNAYLACDSLNIGARYMATLNADMLRIKLRLGKDDDLVCIMPMGKK